MQVQRKTKNEKNQFLYEHFEKELRKAQYINGSNMKFCIQKIMKSLSKYPLPVISGQQALMLEGVGEKSAATIGKLCQKHYRPEFTQQSINLSLNSSQVTGLGQNELISESQSNGIFTQQKKQHVENKNENFLDFISNLQSKPKSKYNIEQNTKPWGIMVSLYYFTQQTSKNFATKKEIKYYAEQLNKVSFFFQNQLQIFPVEVTCFNSINTMLKKQLIDQLEFGDDTKYCLSNDGKQIAQQLYDNRMIILNHDNQQKSQNLDSFQYKIPTPKVKERKNAKKKKISVVQEVKSEDEKSNKKKGVKKRRTRSVQTKTKKQIEKQETQTNEIIQVQEKMNPLQEQQQQYQTCHILNKEEIEKFQIFLIIDNRELFKRDHEEARKVIQNDLREKYGIQDCQIGQLPIGDFMWVIKIFCNFIKQDKNNTEPQIYVLDTIIERKTLDDLASSIVDRRYKDQKHRLKKCGLKHIYYLIEGLKQSANQNIPNSTLESAITSTQVCDGFKIKKTNSLQDSVDFLAKLHLIIYKQFKNNFDEVSQIKFDFTLDQFLQQNTKHLNHNVGYVFGNMVRSIRSCTQDITYQIVDRFLTPLQLYKELSLQGTTDQKIDFLRLQCPSIKNKRLLQTIITLFMFDTFPNILEL